MTINDILVSVYIITIVLGIENENSFASFKTNWSGLVKNMHDKIENCFKTGGFHQWFNICT